MRHHLILDVISSSTVATFLGLGGLHLVLYSGLKVGHKLLQPPTTLSPGDVVWVRAPLLEGYLEKSVRIDQI
uniref:Uncharacterized protein n=1 Tax=Zea mays TaxID=4577 RepID=C0PJE9_MAIZE|nr:unknown [Zea mays]